MSCRMIKLFVLALATTGLMHSSAFAQRIGGRAGSQGPGGLLAYLHRDRVQEELGIAKDAKKVAEIRALSKSLKDETATLHLNTTKPEIEKTREAVKKLEDKYDQDVKKLLSPEENARLRQIVLQAHGRMTLVDADVVKALDISPEQREKLVAANHEFIEGQKKLFGEAHKTQKFEGVDEKVKQLIADWNKAVDGILTKSQNEKFVELQGKPFDLGGASKK